MPDFTSFATARLALSAMKADDAAELFPVLSDPRGWWYEPEHRHGKLATTVGFAERAAARWSTDDLSYWTVRLLDDSAGSDSASDSGSGTVIGLGGAQRHRSGGWNLSYRIAADHQGNGYALELARAGIEAANQVDADAPVIAWILGHNIPSVSVAERAGLVNYGLRVDANDGIERLAFADREL